ncbi:MAG TPA: sporulation transcription factor Spo0A [Pseudogracilibacillus sp.]|nr:sporulation transcription factor Spo0A [Pseudogracilibacillus sp.]
MGKIKVFIADDNAELLAVMKAYVDQQEEMELTGTAGDGEEVLEKLKTTSIDVLVLDIVMPLLDGIEVLRELSKTDVEPLSVIMISAFGQEELLRQTTRFGAAYYLLKPFDMKVFLHKIIEVYQQESTIASVVKEGDERLNQEENRLYLALLNCLEEAGIQPHVKGYQYIKEATWIGFEEIDALSAFTKWIYPAIAKKYQTSVASVERSIRNAIQSAWNQNQALTSSAMFRFSRLKKPTNSEFISALVHHLKIESELTVYN